jgi:Fe-S oxidoreductase
MGAPGVAKVGMKAAGVDPRRSLPRFAEQTFRGWFAEHGADAAAEGSPGRPVVLFVDSFVEHFSPQVGIDAVRVLRAAGYTPIVTGRQVCCGLTWISTGQLGTARRLLAHAAEALDDGTDRPIVVIEPSCAAALRKDLPELVHTEQARRVAARVRSFASHMAERVASGWEPRPASSVPEKAVLQTHCHEYSVFGAAAQRSVLAAAGVREVVDANGCCGVAGNFGFEKEHYDVSMQVAENALAPALRSTGRAVPVLADGFSCARQVDQLDRSRPGLHLAQVLDPGTSPTTSVPTTIAERTTQEAEELS